MKHREWKKAGETKKDPQGAHKVRTNTSLILHGVPKLYGQFALDELSISIIRWYDPNRVIRIWITGLFVNKFDYIITWNQSIESKLWILFVCLKCRFKNPNFIFCFQSPTNQSWQLIMNNDLRPLTMSSASCERFCRLH